MRSLPLFLGLVALPAFAQEPASPNVTPQAARPAGAVDLLLQQSQRWLDQGRPDLAALSVQRALAAEPKNADALLLGVRVEAARNSRDAAASYVARLRSAGTSSAQLASAESELRGSSIDRTAVEEARRLGREGRSEEAASSYRTAFGNREPPRQYAREYYETLAATTAERAAGQHALSQLAAQPGADDRTLLANAEQLTFNPASRAAGLQRLAELATKPTVAADAQRAWKQAIGFSQNDPAAIPLYEDYLRRYPNDVEMRQRLETVRATPAHGAATPSDSIRQRAYSDLDRGRLRSSAEQFESALALDPADAEAMGGLGIIRLRERRPSEARALLERATAANPAKSAQWRRALDAANYSLELAEAHQALQRGSVDGAAAIAQRASHREVDDSADIENLLGEIALRRGDKRDAEQHFRAALGQRRGFAPATAGLAKALGRDAPATPTAPMPQARPASTIDVTRQREEAANAGDPTTSAALLRAALNRAPNNPWLRLDLARALTRDGKEPEARVVMADLASRPASPDADFASALFAHEIGRADDADMLLSRIPAGRRTADVVRLQTQVRGEIEVARATAMLPNAPAQARERLVLLAGQPDPSGSVAANAIRALGKAGDRTSAARAGQVASAANPNAGAQLALAAALYDAGVDDAASAALVRAERGPLSPQQQRDVAALRAGTAIRAADRLNEAGNQAAAYDALRPALSGNPNDPAAQLALSRVYQGARQPAQAQRIAEAVLARNPRDWDARRSAVEAALAAGDRGRAEVLANEAQTLQPGDSRTSLLLAKVARAKGEGGRARALLEQAATQRGQELGRTQAGTDPNQPPPSDNPFVALLTDAPNPALPLDSVAREISEESRQARLDSGPIIAGTGSFRSRSGTPGLDSLTELSGKVEASGQVGSVPGRFSAQISPIVLESGKAGANSYGARQFGTNPVSATGVPNRDTSAFGAALAVGYQHGELVSADIGSTPLGFRTTNVVGGFEVAPKLADTLRLRLRAERRSVTDSLVSYAGARDPLTGQVWGGVTQTGGRAQLDASVGAGSAYAFAGYAALDGRNVAHNDRREAGAGVSYPLLRRGDSVLTSGLDLAYLGYGNNQRSFTFGQGGYFSPQNYIAVNLPIEYSSRIGELRYKIGGSIGYAHFREDPNQIFPNSPNLQSQLEAASRRDSTVAARGAGQTKNGVIGGARVELNYPLSEQLSLVGAVRYDRAADFQETRVSVRLENRF